MRLFQRRRLPAVTPRKDDQWVAVQMLPDDEYAIEQGIRWTFGEPRVERQLRDLLRRFREAVEAHNNCARLAEPRNGEDK